MLIGICVVRNEGDVLGQTLAHAADQYDLILAVDGASTDNTAAVLAEAAERWSHVVVVGRLVTPRRAEEVRRHVWARFRAHVPLHSWWAVLDGDEFCDEDLRAATRVAEAEGADHIQGQFAAFHYRRSDAEDWRAGEETMTDRQRPITERRRHYTMEHYSVRAFHDGPMVRWAQDEMAPDNLIRPWSQRLTYRHYPHRDLDQLELRLASRRALDLSEEFRRVHYHWSYTVDQALMPDDRADLQVNNPGEPLVPHANLPAVWTGSTLGILKRRWRRWRAAAQPVHEEPLFGAVDITSLLTQAGVEKQQS